MKLQTPQNKSYMKNYSSQKYQATNTKVCGTYWHKLKCCWTIEGGNES